MGIDFKIVPKERPSDANLIRLCEVRQRPSLRNLLHKVSKQAEKEQKHLILKAIESRHEELVTLLLENGADPNVKDAIGDTALHVALKTGQNHIAASILKYNADVNTHSRKGLTPLHYAAHQRDHDLVKKLLLKGADVNLPNSEGKTPLMVVCRTGCVPLVKILLQNGSNITISDKLGWKASDYAIIGGIYGELKSLISDQISDGTSKKKDFCEVCGKQETLSPTQSVDSLLNRDLYTSQVDSPPSPKRLPHSTSSFCRGDTSIKHPDSVLSRDLCTSQVDSPPKRSNVETYPKRQSHSTGRYFSEDTSIKHPDSLLNRDLCTSQVDSSPNCSSVETYPKRQSHSTGSFFREDTSLKHPDSLLNRDLSSSQVDSPPKCSNVENYPKRQSHSTGSFFREDTSIKHPDSLVNRELYTSQVDSPPRSLETYPNRLSSSPSGFFRESDTLIKLPDSLPDRDLHTSQVDSPLSNLEAYPKRLPHSTGSFFREDTLIKIPERPLAKNTTNWEDTKEIMEKKNSQTPHSRETLPVDKSCTSSTTSLAQEEETTSYIHTKNVEPTSRQPPQKLDNVLRDISSIYSPSSKLTFTTERLDTIANLVAEETDAKLKAMNYVRGLEEANEILFRLKNDLEQALNAARNALNDKDSRIEEDAKCLHSLKERLSNELDDKKKDQEALKLAHEKAKEKDNICQDLLHDNDCLGKKCKELQKNLEDEKDCERNLKDHVDAMIDQLVKAKDDAIAKNKRLTDLINDINATVHSGSDADLAQPTLVRSSTSLPLLDNQIANTIQNLKDKINGLKRKLDEQGKEKNNLITDNHNLKSLIDDMKADQAKKDADMQEKLDAAKNNKHKLEDQIGGLVRQVKDAQQAADEVKSLTAIINAVEKEKERSEHELKAEQKNNDNLERRIKDLETENSRLRCEVARLRDCLRVTRRQQEKAETKVHELHNELQIGRATLEQCRLTPSCSRTTSADFSNSRSD